MNKVSVKKISVNYSIHPSKKPTVLIEVCGCSMACEDCNKPLLQNHASGIEMSAGELIERVTELRSKQPNVNSVTFSGGEPCDWRNIKAVFEFCKMYGCSKVAIFTGYSPAYLLTTNSSLPEGVLFKCGSFKQNMMVGEVGKYIDEENMWYQLPSINQEFYKVKRGELNKLSEKGKLKIC